MRKFALVALVALLLGPVLAESEAGKVQDREGNTAHVSLVERGEDRFAAVTITNPGKRKNATHLLSRREITRVFLACKMALKSKRDVESNEQVILDSMKGEKAKLDIVLVKPEEVVVGMVVVVENGRERGYILDKDSYEKLASLLRDVKAQL